MWTTGDYLPVVRLVCRELKINNIEQVRKLKLINDGVSTEVYIYSIRIVNDRLGFILFFFILDLDKRCNMTITCNYHTSHKSVTKT